MSTLVHQIQNLINWIDTDALHLTKEELLDSMKIRILVLAKKFIAFPLESPTARISASCSRNNRTPSQTQRSSALPPAGAH